MQHSHEQTYTPEEYWKLVELFPDHKYEYIDGNIRMMSGGSPAHSQIGGNIVTLLNIALHVSECNVYNSDAKVKLNEQRCYLPDAAVSCDPHDWTRKNALESPTVVVEVLSQSTEKVDRTEKLEAYQRYPTIQEILLVDSRRRYVEHYHRIGVSQWLKSIFESDDDLVDLSSIDVSLYLRDMYRKVYLEVEEA
jgi:Uma2 family endonuclease